MNVGMPNYFILYFFSFFFSYFSDDIWSYFKVVMTDLVVCLCFSGKDNMLPSGDEAKRLGRTLKNCRVRIFKDNGHTLLLVGGLYLFKYKLLPTLLILAVVNQFKAVVRTLMVSGSIVLQCNVCYSKKWLAHFVTA